MLDFDEELKKFKPSTEADPNAPELSGNEAADLLSILSMAISGGDGASDEDPGYPVQPAADPGTELRPEDFR